MIPTIRANQYFFNSEQVRFNRSINVGYYFNLTSADNIDNIVAYNENLIYHKCIVIAGSEVDKEK